MGTRADFWIGHGPEAEWLGSVAWDGDEWWDQPQCPLMQAKTAEDYRAAVAKILEERDDATIPSDGWPWPWETSATTDYAYVFHEGLTNVYGFGEHKVTGEPGDWRDMSALKNVTFGKRSGVIIVGGGMEP